MDDHQLNERLPDIRHTVELHAPIDKVWEAVATSEGLAAWFMPNDLQAAEGHEFHLQAGPFGQSPCIVTRVDPPHRLSFKWGKDWTLTFELVEKEGQTEVTVIHGGWSVDQVTEFGETHAIVRDRMDQGWGGLVGKLSAYIGG